MVKSAARVLEVFEHFSAVRAPCSVAQMCSALGYPQSSTSMLMKCLHEQGYLEYDRDTRRYSPTARVALLGAWVDPGDALSRLLQQLRDATGETVILAQRHEAQVRYIQVVQSEADLRLHLKPGTLRPLNRAAVGRALLAGLSDAMVARLVRKSNALDPAGPVAEREVLHAVNEVRAFGYTMTLNTVTQGAGVIAAPWPGARGPALAIGVGAPVARLRRQRKSIVGALLATIEQAASQPPDTTPPQETSP